MLMLGGLSKQTYLKLRHTEFLHIVYFIENLTSQKKPFSRLMVYGHRETSMVKQFDVFYYFRVHSRKRP